ncbi:MAG: response regulator [Chloroflexota bacterium]
MARQVDKEVLRGFIEEAQSYLPEIQEALGKVRADETKTAVLEDARIYMHTIKGAASMVGLNGLSHMAYFMEESLEDVIGNDLDYSGDVDRFWRQTLGHIEAYLDKVLVGGLRERPLVVEITHAYRRVRGLPVAEDETAVAEILADLPDEPVNTAATEEPRPHSILEDGISPELIEAFTLEAEDHLRQASLMLNQLDKEPTNKEVMQEIRRSIHTLKGAAATVGFPTITDLSHRIEDLLELAYEGAITLSEAQMTLLFSSVDMLEDMLSDSVTGEQLQSIYAQYDQWAPTSSDAPTAPANLSDIVGSETIIDLSEMRPAVAQPAADGAAARPSQPEEVVRVPLERLNDLIRLASELVIGRSTFEQRLGDLNRIADEMEPSINRLRRISNRLETQYEVAALATSRLRSVAAVPAGPDGTALMPSNGGTVPVQPVSFLTQEFDDLEMDRYTEFHLLSRELSEATSDIRLVSNELGNLITDFDSILNGQSRLTSELQDKLMRTRMVPLASLTTRFHRAVRVVARKQAKKVNLIIEGEEIDLDKKVLEEMVDPLLHVLRNAVDHGIEPPALRQVIGKPENGEIRIRAFYEGNQVIIQIRDDGAGLEPEVLRAKAIEGGFLSEADAAALRERDLYRLIFVPGFSTADEIDEISGRGVGMDILKANVQKLKGTVSIDSRPGEETLFTIRLPMTLAVTRALLVRANHETFALPLNAVTQILRMERQKIDHVGQEPVVKIGNTVYPAHYLGKTLNLPQPPDETKKRISALVVNTGDNQIALIVDEVLEGREIVVKPLGNHLRRVHGITGATLLGDGTVVLILNPSEVLDVDEGGETAVWQPPTSTPTPAARQREALNILVVDDSVSVRRVVSSLVRSAGWHPLTAKDGLEALETIQSLAQLPDAILLDIEMPRMDGYELTATLRANDNFKHIPIIMLTSRAGDKHRRKALDLGVSDYLVKPYTDEVLLDAVRTLTRVEA